MYSKSILCISWCDADEVVNYGQILQAMAMMKLLRERNDGQIKYISYRNRSLREHFDYYFYHCNFRNGHIQAYIKTKRTLNSVIRNNNISFFQVMNKKMLDTIAIDSNVLICGSDQIWHPQNYDKNYFLDFGKSKQKKIAFAASLPKTQQEKMYAEKYAMLGELLKDFDAIAVREHSSVDFIKTLSNRDDVIDVLDPTFLVKRSFWDKLVEPMNIANKYIFVYIPNGMDKKLEETVNIIKEKTHVEDVYVLMTRGENLFENAKIMKFVSVGEFLYLISHASCVITSSFHAVVFSSIFHTDFYAYDVPNAKRGEDCRISDILSLMKLKDRNIGKETFSDFKNINFDDVENRLSTRRMKSVEFLNNQLKE